MLNVRGYWLTNDQGNNTIRMERAARRCVVLATTPPSGARRIGRRRQLVIAFFATDHLAGQRQIGECAA